ncbi:MAG TPA: hypothetical protein VGD88_00285 [Opitutaceae bacterium]
MVYFVAAFSLLLHIVFWGAGLSLLVTPRRWRRYWAFFATAAGIALQSAVVWVAAVHTDLPGANAYGGASLLIPAGLLALAFRLRGWIEIRDGVRRAAGVYALTAVILGGLMIPASSATKVLTSMSLGSCDAADYAAGARVLGEFARSDRTGFMGLTEVVQIHSVDNFFDYWTRLNHFTPSALLALNNAVFGWKFYQTVSVMAAVVVAAAIPLVFWIARTLFGFGPLTAGWLALLYGVNPVTLYSVWHVAIGQTLAAMGIALLTWCAIDAWRQRAGWRQMVTECGLLMIAFWILLGSYNFILLVCMVPAVAYVGGQTLWSRNWRQSVKWAVAMLLPLTFALLIFFERTAGLMERLLLLQQYDFGWRIPVLLTDGWLGLVKDIHLERIDGSVSWVLIVIFSGLLAWSLIRGARLREPAALFAVCSIVPIAAGYAFLQIRGARLGTNASYDAYKLLAVFHPLVLGGLTYWLSKPLIRTVAWRAVAVVAAAFVLAGNLRTAYASALRMESPPLIVDQDMVGVQQMESRPDVTSVNLRISDFWTRIWANAFLLRKAQYFSQHTYEGRRNTELKGEWDLLGGLIQVRVPDRAGHSRIMGPRFSLLRTDSPHFFKVQLGDGWFERESAPRSAPWRWTRGDASIEVDNPHPYPLRVGLSLRGRSLVRRDVQLWQNGLLERRFNMGMDMQTVDIPPIELQPGRTVLELRSSVPPGRANAEDDRLLGLMVQGIDFTVLPRPPPHLP